MGRIRETLSLPAPREYARSVQEIPYERLQRLGFRTLLFDYDNTLAPWKSIVVNEKTLLLFTKLIEMGFQICVVTNAPPKRAQHIINRFKGKIPVFGSMRKPGIRNLTRVVNAINADASKTVIIGDLLFTDIIAGNRMKMYTIMVNPYQEGVISFLGKTAKIITRVTHSIFYYTVGWFFHLSEMISPNEFQETVFDIDFPHLKTTGFETIVFDLDNTLIRWKSRVFPDSTIALLRKVQEMGFCVYILSNTTSNHRVQFVQEQLGHSFFVWGRMKKPFPGKMKSILERNACDLQKTVVVGDQLFTDVFVGNILRAYTIKVQPLFPEKEFLGTRILRIFERLLSRYMKPKPRIPGSTNQKNTP